MPKTTEMNSNILKQLVGDFMRNAIEMSGGGMEELKKSVLERMGATVDKEPISVKTMQEALQASGIMQVSYWELYCVFEHVNIQY